MPPIVQLPQLPNAPGHVTSTVNGTASTRSWSCAKPFQPSDDELVVAPPLEHSPAVSSSVLQPLRAVSRIAVGHTVASASYVISNASFSAVANAAALHVFRFPIVSVAQVSRFASTAAAQAESTLPSALPCAPLTFESGSKFTQLAMSLSPASSSSFWQA